MKLYKLVLVDKIHEAEAEGWSLINNRVHKNAAMGEWASVYVVKEAKEGESYGD